MSYNLFMRYSKKFLNYQPPNLRLIFTLCISATYINLALAIFILSISVNLICHLKTCLLQRMLDASVSIELRRRYLQRSL